MKIYLKLDPHKGGDQTFSGTAEALAWFDEQVRSWESPFGSIDNPNLPIFAPLRALKAGGEEMRAIRSDERKRPLEEDVYLN